MLSNIIHERFTLPPGFWAGGFADALFISGGTVSTMVKLQGAEMFR